MGDVRTPVTNMCVETGTINQPDGLKMITSMKDLSQALEVARILISTSQEEKFLTIVKKFSISPPPQEDWEVSLDIPYQSSKETNESCTIINGEHPLEPKIEEFLTCISADP